MRTFLVSAYSIVGSEKAHSGLLRTVFKTFGNKKLARLDSNHMCISPRPSIFYFTVFLVFLILKLFQMLCLYFSINSPSKPFNLVLVSH